MKLISDNSLAKIKKEKIFLVYLILFSFLSLVIFLISIYLRIFLKPNIEVSFSMTIGGFLLIILILLNILFFFYTLICKSNLIMKIITFSLFFSYVPFFVNMFLGDIFYSFCNRAFNNYYFCNYYWIVTLYLPFIIHIILFLYIQIILIKLFQKRRKNVSLRGD